MLAAGNCLKRDASKFLDCLQYSVTVHNVISMHVTGTYIRAIYLVAGGPGLAAGGRGGALEWSRRNAGSGIKLV